MWFNKAAKENLFCIIEIKRIVCFVPGSNFDFFDLAKA